MNTIGEKEILDYFPFYLKQYEKLSAELDAIPYWRFIKWDRKMRQIRHLQDWYDSKMREWDL